jgi:NADH-ubiquinone oxidoreductase chain 5
MYILVILLPLVSFSLLSLGGRYFGKQGSISIAISCMLITVFCAFVVFYEVALCQSVCNIKILNWMNLGVLNLNWGFLFDTLTAVMLVVVTGISCLVHIYSINYMNSDPHIIRFISYLSLFTFFMLMLITADNLFQMFLGWEGVGLASYLLINFWFTRTQANKSALKAIILNRVGDFGLALGIFVIFMIYKSLDFTIIFALVPLQELTSQSIIFFGLNFNIVTLIGLLLFVGTIGKSAQLGLHMWLPDAMEGPTPVSALIHAATMVTAGVFILLRLSPLISYSSTALIVITIFGALTALFAATIGVVQNDLKRVIAYSTCSQLGYMVFSSGLLNYNASLFHLTTHAFFKALLFLSAGVIIHAISEEQDMRKMGGLLKLLPFTYVVILIGSLALIGFPFLAGFYSKDIILEYAFTKSYYQWDAEFAYFLGTLAAFFTAFYSFRLIMLTFIFKTNSNITRLLNIEEAPLFLGLPLFILAFFSIFIGFILKDMFVGLGSSFFNNALFNLPLNNIYLELEFIPVSIKLIPVFFSLLGALISIYSYFFLITNLYLLKFIKFPKIYYFLIKKWYFDVLINSFIVPSFMKFAYDCSFKIFDRGLFELIGPFGLSKLFNKYSIKAVNLQSGFIYHYAFIIILGLILFLTLYIFVNSFDYLLLFLVLIYLPILNVFSIEK